MSEQSARQLLGERFVGIRLQMENYSRYTEEQKRAPKPFTNYPGWDVGWHAAWRGPNGERVQVRAETIAGIWKAIADQEEALRRFREQSPQEKQHEER